MSKEPCKCCQEDKKPPKGGFPGRRYNKARGTSAKWVRRNEEAKSEFTIRVKGGKRFGGPKWIKDTCGDGTFGFPTRRKGQDEVSMEQGLDGQFKKKRSTLVRRRSARAVASRQARQVWGSKCTLWSSVEIIRTQRDPLVLVEQEKAHRKMKRKENHRKTNRNKSRRAVKRSHKRLAA